MTPGQTVETLIGPGALDALHSRLQQALDKPGASHVSLDVAVAERVEGEIRTAQVDVSWLTDEGEMIGHHVTFDILIPHREPVQLSLLATPGA